MTIVLQREISDCEEAACATATGRTWEELHKALGKKGMPNSLEDPLASNPANVKRAVESLGFRCDETPLADLLMGRAVPMKTVVLIHSQTSPTLSQHWVCWGGIAQDGHHLLYFGDSETPRKYSGAGLARLVTAGFPNCCFQCVPVARPAPWYRRILVWLGLRRG